MCDLRTSGKRADRHWPPPQGVPPARIAIRAGSGLVIASCCRVAPGIQAQPITGGHRDRLFLFDPATIEAAAPDK